MDNQNQLNIVLDLARQMSFEEKLAFFDALGHEERFKLNIYSEGPEVLRDIDKTHIENIYEKYMENDEALNPYNEFINECINNVVDNYLKYGHRSPRKFGKIIDELVRRSNETQEMVFLVYDDFQDNGWGQSDLERSLIEISNHPELQSVIEFNGTDAKDKDICVTGYMDLSLYFKPQNKSIDEQQSFEARLKEVKLMHETVKTINDEEAYWTRWVYEMPDEPTRADFEDFADIENNKRFEELKKCFRDIMADYGGSGLYAPSREVAQFAKEYMPEIEILKPINKQEINIKPERNENSTNVIEEPEL